MQGQFCEVLGWTHRNEILHLTLVLPDGSRSLIPAHWTDLSGRKTKNLTSTGSHSISNIIATTHDLLHVRKIVDALLCKLNSSKQEFKKASTEKSKRATGTFSQITEIISAPADLQDPNPPAAKKCHNRPDQPYQQNGLYREHKSESGAKP